MREINVLLVGIPHEMIQNWGWFLVFGIGLVLLGIAALIRSVKATVISMSFLGCSKRAFKSGACARDNRSISPSLSLPSLKNRDAEESPSLKGFVRNSVSTYTAGNWLNRLPRMRM